MNTIGRATLAAFCLSAALTVGAAGPAHAARDGMHGDPAAAAPYWRYQQQELDCGEMAVADVIGQITGREPTEDEITGVAASIPSESRSGPIYRPSGRTKNGDLAVLLRHYGLQASAVHTDLGGLERALDGGTKVIVGLNDRIIWNEPGDRSVENHFVVVTGIDTAAGVVHLNDSGIKAGRDEQVPIGAFEQAWATSDHFAVLAG
ncbi:C39 family peptidase [Mycobacterium sp. Marseille-P9652]|uniref:C39 family peptidase n=1 Tax=Mycobacterium sp. Marseille-P9652 TaxID=2654950 RepID=UPI0012E8B6F5|nr:C39 family peptidase [Mycobacterium sp. Marseille-P9652]